MALGRPVETNDGAEDLAAIAVEAARPLLDGSPLGIGVLGPDGQLRYANAALATMLGAPVEEVDLEALLAPPTEVDEHAGARLARLRRGELDAYTIERRIARAEETAVLRLHVASTRPSAVAPLSLLVQVEDLTEQVGAADRAPDEARFDALARHASEVVLVADADARVRYVSPAVTRVLGYEPEEFLRTAGEVLIHPDDRTRWHEELDRVAADPGARATVEVRGQHADGRYLWLEATVVSSLADPAVHGIVVHFHDVSDRHRAIQDLLHQAVHDGLTGLPNRALLLDRLGHALDRAARHKDPRVAVLFLDVDHFKHVNDSLGHAGGDELLSQVATRLRTVVRPSDTVARMGGDEFVVCCEDVGDTEAMALAERVLEVFRTPYSVSGREIRVSTSVGIALASRPSDTPDTLLRDADAAMYVAKSHGRDRLEVFDDTIRARALRRIETEDDLRRALDHDELVLHYQPVWDLRTGTIRATEALLRWRHPGRGLLPPAEFLTIAAESGLVVRIGEWALREACRQRRSWEGLDPRGEYRTMWVNLAAHQLARPDFFDSMAGILTETGTAPGTIGLEITEPVLMESDRTDAASRGLARLASLGCRLAIDDFGTGYSSLRYVHRYHVDTLKVDPSFVRGLPEREEDRAVVAAMVSLGGLLSADVSAEGVETEEQLRWVRELGCHSASGYLLAGPASPQEVSEILAAGARLDRPGGGA